jgi:hypothetical protein
MIAKSPEELFKERVKRIGDVINIKEPDRVPITPFLGTFPSRYAGVSIADYFFNIEKSLKAFEKTNVDFDFDACQFAPSSFSSGYVVKGLGMKQLRVPGADLPSDTHFQWIQDRWLGPEWYDEFLSNSVESGLKGYLPKVMELFKPFEQIPSLVLGFNNPSSLLSLLAFIATPEASEAIEKLLVLAREHVKFARACAEARNRLRDLGYPTLRNGSASVPYDMIYDYVRGTGINLDMYRIPDKVKSACKKIEELIIPLAINGIKALPARTTPIPSIFIPLHAGHFMSLKMFEEFYWPSLKKMICSFADNDIISYVYFEYDWTPYLKYLRELPKGKVIGIFEKAKMSEVKKNLGERMCIGGGVPMELLSLGTPKDVKDYCKKLIEELGEGGGYILDCGIPLDYASKPENVKAMVEATREYGVYRK